MNNEAQNFYLMTLNNIETAFSVNLNPNNLVNNNISSAPVANDKLNRQNLNEGMIMMMSNENYKITLDEV